MNVVDNILELPKEYYMLLVEGKTPIERYNKALSMIPKNKEAWYIEGGKYKASPAYLMLVKKLPIE